MFIYRNLRAAAQLLPRVDWVRSYRGLARLLVVGGVILAQAPPLTPDPPHLPRTVAHATERTLNVRIHARRPKDASPRRRRQAAPSFSGRGRHLPPSPTRRTFQCVKLVSTLVSATGIPLADTCWLRKRRAGPRRLSAQLLALLPRWAWRLRPWPLLPFPSLPPLLVHGRGGRLLPASDAAVEREPRRRHREHLTHLPRSLNLSCPARYCRSCTLTCLKFSATRAAASFSRGLSIACMEATGSIAATSTRPSGSSRTTTLQGTGRRRPHLPAEALRERAWDCTRRGYGTCRTPHRSSRAASWTSMSVRTPNPSDFKASIVRVTASSKETGSVVLKNAITKSLQILFPLHVSG